MARKAKANGRSRKKTAAKPAGRKAGDDEVAASSSMARFKCPIVGVGGSAGGFEAPRELLKTLSPKNGMALVIVQHLDPRHASRLPSLLGRATKMPVLEVTRRTEVQPN